MKNHDYRSAIMGALLALIACAMLVFIWLVLAEGAAYAEALDHLCDDTGVECAEWADCQHPEIPPDEPAYTLVCPPDIWASDFSTELFMPYVLRVEIDAERLEHADYLRVDLWLPYSNAMVYDVLLTDLWTWAHAEITCIGDNALRLRFAAEDAAKFEDGAWTYLIVVAH